MGIIWLDGFSLGLYGYNRDKLFTFVEDKKNDYPFFSIGSITNEVDVLYLLDSNVFDFVSLFC